MQIWLYHTCYGKFFSEYDPTIEDTCTFIIKKGTQVFLVALLDTAGQEEYSAMRDQYMREGQGFIFGYTITSKHSFEEMTDFIEQVQRVKESLKDSGAVLVGNKLDLETERQVPNSAGESLAKKYGMPFLEMSCATGVNTKEVMWTAVITTVEKRNQPVQVTGEAEKDKKCTVM